MVFPRLGFAAALFTILIPVAAQVNNPAVVRVSSAPSGSCITSSAGQLEIPTGVIYTCQNGTWGQVSGGGGGGAALPFPGIVFGTSATTGTVATSSQVQSAIGSGVYDASGAAAAAQAASVPLASKDVASGVPSLDSNARIPQADLPIQVPTTGLAALALFDSNDYNSNATSVVIHDKSGNGNNGTASLSGQVTWSQIAGAYALNYSAAGASSGIINIAGIAAPRTIVVIVQGTASSTASGGIYSPFIGYSLGTLSFAFFTQNRTMATANSFYIASSGVTSGVTLPVSYNMIAVTLQTSASSGTPNGFFIGATQMPCLDYASCGLTVTPAGGNLQIMGSSSSGFAGGRSAQAMSIIGYVVYTTVETQAQIQQIYGALADYFVKRGIDIKAKTSGLHVSQAYNVISDGSSIEAGYLSNTPPATTMSLGSSYTVNVNAVPSSGTQGHALAQANPDFFFFNPKAGRNIYLMGGPTNDLCEGSNYLYGGNTTPLQAWSNTYVWANYVHLFDPNGLVVVQTMISRGGNAASPNTGTCDANKDTVNTLIRQYSQSMANVALADVAAQPLLGADGAYANTTYFQSDQTHETIAGAGLEGAVMQAAIQANTATYNDSNPNYQTGGAYSMTVQDRSLVHTPNTVGVTDTLPECIGLTGYSYKISNPSATNILTIAGLGSETITGSPVITSLGTAVFDVALISAAAGGCSWTRTQ
jgi:trimeric autotransporter adhesin